jgi:DNA-binding MarR family transcriptional regulator
MPTPRSTPLSDSDPRVAWHRLLQVSSRVLREIDVRLDLHHRMGVNEFDVLITLDNAQDKSLRMTDLARATMLSSGGLTRLVGRLEDRGLLQRVPDPDDGRAFQATLTDAGRANLAEARVTHDAVVDELLGSRLTKREVAALNAVLGHVLEEG